MPDRTFSFRTKLLVLLAVFAVKLAMSVWLHHLSACSAPERKIGLVSFASGDHFSYVGAIEHYIDEGKYYFINQKRAVIYAGRTPHFIIPYYLFRSFLSPAAAQDVYSLLVLLLDALCISHIILYTAQRTRNKLLIALIAVAGTLSTYITSWVGVTVPDGLSAILIFLLFWNLFLSNAKWKYKNTFTAGLLFNALITVYIIIIRPFMILPAAIFWLVWLLQRKGGIKSWIRTAGAMAISGILLIGPWAWRNWTIFHRLVPLQQDAYAGYGYTPGDLAARKLCAAFGEDASTYWDPKTMASWITPASSATSKFQLPAAITRDTAMHQSVLMARQYYAQSDTSAAAEEKLVAIVPEIRTLLRQKDPADYYLVYPGKLIAKFWLHSGSYYLPISEKFACYQSWQKLFKIAQSILYYVVLAGGILSVIVLLFRKRYAEAILFGTLMAGLTLMLPIAFGAIEWRFTVPFYYFNFFAIVFVIVSKKGKFQTGRSRDQAELINHNRD